MATNSFPIWAHVLFQQSWSCWYCGKNVADALHHIVGRGNSSDSVESSILNAAPICNNSCHLYHHGEISTDKYRKIFLNRTYDFLLSTHYEFSDKDMRFIQKYSRYYE